ncbi:MAG: DUF3179 domain-containing protein [Phycisphaerae bacterium]|nr:DUF3179 domain-containing protein [Phycisphaerae bacterium]
MTGKHDRPLTVLNAAVAASHGFDLTTCLISRKEIRAGGPPKDGIPALTRPPTVPGHEARHLGDDDRVIGISLGQESRAYPLAILNYHENVNDELGRKSIAVTYCPLCDSAIVFDRVVDGQTRDFGISGLLYNSNVLLYDRQPSGRGESLWSQLQMRAVAGPAAQRGLKLSALPCELTPWADWKNRHPDTTVLSANTGFARDYRRNPYSRYFASDRLMFPVSPRPDGRAGLRNKDKLVVVKIGDSMRAYPVRTVARGAGSRGWIEDTLQDKRVRLIHTGASDTVRIEFPDALDGHASVMYTFWFAWYAMHPKSQVFAPPG